MYHIFGGYIIIYKQILKIIELDIKDTHPYLLKISNLYTVRHRVLVQNWTDKQKVLWNVNRCSTVASL